MKKNVIIAAVAVVVLLAAAAPSIYFYRQYQQAQMRINDPTGAARQDALNTVAAVGKLMVLPTDEDPTVAMITDITKLKDQPFFAHAENGDKVLIYTKNKKAILYRPSTNKIIDVAPVNIGNTTPTPSPAVTTAPSSTPGHTPTPTLKPATQSGTVKPAM